MGEERHAYGVLVGKPEGKIGTILIKWILKK
jgi:hypothetical protein